MGCVKGIPIRGTGTRNVCYQLLLRLHTANKIKLCSIKFCLGSVPREKTNQPNNQQQQQQKTHYKLLKKINLNGDFAHIFLILLKMYHFVTKMTSRNFFFSHAASFCLWRLPFKIPLIPNLFGEHITSMCMSESLQKEAQAGGESLLYQRGRMWRGRVPGRLGFWSKNCYSKTLGAEHYTH